MSCFPILHSAAEHSAFPPREILGNPAAYIESSLYFSWEQYFTDLLVHLTQETVLRYNKGKLNPAYLQSANVEKILDAM